MAYIISLLVIWLLNQIALENDNLWHKLYLVDRMSHDLMLMFESNCELFLGFA